MSKPVRWVAAISIVCSVCLADEALYRYEGDVAPYHESAGWLIYNPCEEPCSEALDDDHFVLHWPTPNDMAHYNHRIAEPPHPPPPSLWVEWRFRSNHPIGPNFYTCDAMFTIDYVGIIDAVYMYGDAAISASGDYAVFGLNIDQFHTYRFESPDGLNYRISVDGLVFVAGVDPGGNAYHSISFLGDGGCGSDWIPDMVNEWDMVRYGTISYGEQIVAAEPPSGFLDPDEYAGLDRFAITFDSPNYVYIDDIDVSTSGGPTPEVTQTWRRENDEPDTLEIVLDQPIPPGQRTVFTIDDGEIINTVQYTFIHGDANADGHIDLADFARMQTCFAPSPPIGTCQAFDFDNNDVVDLTDFSQFQSTMTGLVP